MACGRNNACGTLPEKPMRFEPSLFFAILMVAVSGLAVLTASKWPFDTALLPLVIGIPMLGLSLLQLIRELVYALKSHRRREAPVQAADIQTDWSVPQAVVVRRAATLFGYLLGLILAIVLLGFFIAMPLCTFLYLKFHGRETWSLSAALAVAVLLLLKAFDQGLHPVWLEGVVSWPDVMIRDHLLNF